MNTNQSSPAEDKFQPLAGMRVLDLSKVLAGPLCTQYLGDMGADVIKVEPCEGGDDTRQWPPFEDDDGTIFLSVNRNKRSLALDLKSAEGQAICHRLVREADIVVESFGPGVAKRLKVDFDTLNTISPAIIYCSLSGYGTRGPMEEGKGYDVILQAFCGMLSITGEPDGPPVRSPFSPVDQATGLHSVIGILGAVVQRGATGRGMKIETSLFDSAVHFLGYFLQGFWQRGTEPARPGSGHESLCPYQSFETRDKPLILGVANDGLWREFCDVAGTPKLASDPRFRTGADRVRNRGETVALVQEILRRKTRDEWIVLLEARSIPCSPVHTLGELSAHPHTDASGMILNYRNAKGRMLNAVASPIRVNGDRPPLRQKPPALGADSVDILREHGYQEDEIRRFVEMSVIRADNGRESKP
jgi:crotonobetainyl-CoA:carnitine CoA-transferase CaiB-like acyl-CoA transferase